MCAGAQSWGRFWSITGMKDKCSGKKLLLFPSCNANPNSGKNSTGKEGRLKEQHHKWRTEKSALKPGFSLKILELQSTGIVLPAPPRARKPSLHSRGGAEAAEGLCCLGGGESQPGIAAGSSEQCDYRAGKCWEQKILWQQQEQLGCVTQRPWWRGVVVTHRAPAQSLLNRRKTGIRCSEGTCEHFLARGSNQILCKARNVSESEVSNSCN